MTAIKFGRGFELDPGAYELRRGGRPVTLARIPMEILLLLVEHRPNLVTREQIIEKIWGPGVFVDTNNSINGAIRKLRQALRDDPGNPRHIVTVTGKGYRFIAPVSGDQAAVPGASPPPITAIVVPDAGPAARTLWQWPVLLAAIVLAGAVGAYLYWSRSVAASQSEERVMLAVLPFENLTGDAGQDYFSDGLTEEMISRLGSLAPQRLGVIARTSVMSLKQSRPTLDEVGRQLGVQYVLEGSVRRDSENVRITAQLIQVKDQTHLWARQYDRKHSEVLKVQAEIAQAIADQIELTFGEHPAPPRPSAPLSPRELEAYDHYLKGRYFWSQRTREGFLRAIAAFQQAIVANPAEARAYAGLADTYGLMGTYSFAPAAEVVPKAREAALAALRIDERLAAAHTSLALINEFFDRDSQAAENRFRRALELDMNYATAHHWYAEVLAHQGRFEEAFAEMERARQLDPMSRIIAGDYAAMLYLSRQYDKAIRQFRSVPDIQRGYMIIPAYVEAGRSDEALAFLNEWLETIRSIGSLPSWVWAWAAYTHGRAGRQEEALHALNEMEKANRTDKLEPHGMCAIANVGMRRKEEAFACLLDACEAAPNVLVALKVDPLYDPLRSDPRFQELLRCAGFIQ